MSDVATNEAVGDSTTAGYPSAVAPGLPAFTLDVPNGWQVGEFPDALLAAVAPPAIVGFDRI